ncbi:MAG: ribonuclease P protein component 4 [Methanomassiliicoccales archaeon]|nr:ribonuclease P protein component 4 [Methanomassiliicoccales archaeon]
MSRKTVSNNQVRGIARKRMDILVRASEKEALSGNMERSKRYMSLALRISGRNKVSMPASARYCPKCLAPMVPGLDCRVRLRDHKVIEHCLDCDAVKRTPYLREIRERRTCRKGP